MEHNILEFPQTDKDGVYETSPVKRNRRTKAQIRELEDAIYDDLEDHNPATVRHCFYRMVSLAMVPKNDSGYGFVQRALLKMRRDGRLPYPWIADGTRWRIKGESYGSLLESMEDHARTYRRDIWRKANVYVEIWCESDSIAGIINDVTHEYDVPLLPSRGFSSETFLYTTAEIIAQVGKPAFIYYFGDWDVSGRRIPEKIEAGLRRFAPDAHITFVRAAINQDQIKEYGLPTMPAKKKGDLRTVEIEALPVEILLDLVRGCIEMHLDPHQMKVAKVAEESERGVLGMLCSQLRNGGLRLENDDD